MDSIRLSRLLSLAAIGAVVAVCAGSGLARPAQPAQAVLTDATGEFRLANSRDGQAIFQASGLAPGRSVTGTVDLVNTGGLPGDLSLQQLDVQDQPGAGGGRLSNAVTLDIKDVTGGSSIPIFAGQLGGLGSRQLGAIGPSETRTFRFTASLPDNGLPPGPTTGDNAYAGSGLTVRYAWTATATGTGPGPSEVVKPVVKLKVNSKKLLKRGILDVMATCDVACRVSAYAQLPKARGARKAARTRSRTATLTAPNKAARIRLKLSKKAERQLTAMVRKKKRVAVKVVVGVSAASGGPSTTYTRKASVMRQRQTRARR
jgi:spore coat-associated protein N